MNSDGDPINDPPPGPPTFITLLKGWLREDPVLNPHFYLVDYTEGTYIQTRCNSPLQQKLEHGYALACFPNGEWWAPAGTGKSNDPNRITIFYHGEEPRTRGYLKREDPQFFEKLRKYLILGHDALFEVTNCKIKHSYAEISADWEKAKNQKWWEKGVDL